MTGVLALVIAFGGSRKEAAKVWRLLKNRPLVDDPERVMDEVLDTLIKVRNRD